MNNLKDRENDARDFEYHRRPGRRPRRDGFFHVSERGVVEHNRSERRISHSTDLLVDSRMGAAYAGATNKSGD